MAVLRCPSCGEKIDADVKFCSHCGNPIDKPVVDNYATNYQEAGRLIFKCIGFVVLWFVIVILLGLLVHSVLHLPMNYLAVFVVGLVLTVVIWIIK